MCENQVSQVATEASSEAARQFQNCLVRVDNNEFEFRSGSMRDEHVPSLWPLLLALGNRRRRTHKQRVAMHTHSLRACLPESKRSDLPDLPLVRSCLSADFRRYGVTMVLHRVRGVKQWGPSRLFMPVNGVGRKRNSCSLTSVTIKVNAEGRMTSAICR
jgi:hypothetical protein